MTLADLQELFSDSLSLTREEISKLDQQALVENAHGDPKLPRRERNIQAIRNNLLLSMIEWNEIDHDSLLDRWYFITSRAIELGDFCPALVKVHMLGVEHVLSLRS
mgnify:FL=1